MARVFMIFRSATNFVNHKIWKMRLDKLDKKQGFFIRQLRVFLLAIRGFNEDKCLLKASALTYFTLFSIVPIIALLFAIAKGFGFEKKLQADLLQDFNQNADILNKVFEYANTMLESTKGGVIAGVGIFLLIWTVMKLLGSIEESLNEIWEIKKGRTYIRKFTDYLAILLLAPILLLISGSVTVLLKSSLGSISNSIGWLQHLGPVFAVLLKLASVLLMSGLFTFLYIVLPNTKVNFKSALMAGIVSGLLFELLEWAYLSFQIGAVRYNAIYGSFAALPLFLIWVQYSWFIFLFGAELAFANQNVMHYELENEIQGISVRYKRVLSLLVANIVVKNFIEGKEPLTASEIAQKLDLPVRLARNIIFEFTETRIFSEVKHRDDKDLAYQPAMSESKLTAKFILDTLDKRGVNEIPIQSTKELETIHKLMDDFDQVLTSSRGNVLVKDIL
ncbi:MAG: YihY/virulence factor BrkB family protein [Bacteroidia bacterium]